MKDKGELVLSAIELVRVGEALEAAKNTLRELVASGASYESDKMRRALADCQILQAQWDALEKRHLALKKL